MQATQTHDGKQNAPRAVTLEARTIFNPTQASIPTSVGAGRTNVNEAPETPEADVFEISALSMMLIASDLATGDAVKPLAGSVSLKARAACRGWDAIVAAGARDRAPEELTESILAAIEAALGDDGYDLYRVWGAIRHQEEPAFAGGTKRTDSLRYIVHLARAISDGDTQSRTVGPILGNLVEELANVASPAQVDAFAKRFLERLEELRVFPWALEDRRTP